ncbi:phage tail tape measure protein, partial [Acinetobacter baumannii]
VAGAGAAAMAIPVHLAIDYESAMADVKKVVNFETPQQFKIMGDDIIRLSTKLPMAAKDIAAIVAAGGQSGIAKNELLGFAESAVKMG